MVSGDWHGRYFMHGSRSAVTGCITELKSHPNQLASLGESLNRQVSCQSGASILYWMYSKPIPEPHSCFRLLPNPKFMCEIPFSMAIISRIATFGIEGQAFAPLDI
jgi:hypothetical protein